MQRFYQLPRTGAAQPEIRGTCKIPTCPSSLILANLKAQLFSRSSSTSSKSTSCSCTSTTMLQRIPASAPVPPTTWGASFRSTTPSTTPTRPAASRLAFTSACPRPPPPLVLLISISTVKVTRPLRPRP